jgi:hypothetical protein
MLEDDEITVRPEIMAFAEEMERVMRAHDGDYEDSYKRMSTNDFRMALLTIHRRAAHIQEDMEPDGYPARIPNLAARIGCYTMFFHYRYKVQHDTTD